MAIQPYAVKPLKPKLKVLIYGRPGVGKTQFGATAQQHPDMKDVLFLNVEGGLLTVAGQGVFAADVGKGTSGKHNVISDLESVIFAIAGKKPGYESINTIVVDSASEIQTKELEDSGLDYKTNTTTLKRVFRMLKDLNVNVVFTALANTEYKQNTTEPQSVSPGLTPKVGESLMGYVDCVWYYFKDSKGERCLLTNEKGVFRAKTRNAKFQSLIGEVVKNPNLSELYTKLCEALNG